MRIVTDSGTDLPMTAEQAAKLDIHTVPLIVTLEGKSYREGIDIQPEEFYPLLEGAESMPVTSQPSAGDFAAVPWLFRTSEVWEPELTVIGGVDELELVLRDSTMDVIGVRRIVTADGPIALEPSRNFSSFRVPDRTAGGESRVFDGEPGRVVRVAVPVRD